MTKTHNLIGASILFVGLLLALWGITLTQKAESSAPIGLPATIHTVSQVAIGPQERIVIFAGSTFCSSRIIATRGTEALFSFASSSVSGMATSSNHLALSGRGLTQGASTTVAYDGGLYGCGPVGALAYSSTTITVIEAN